MRTMSTINKDENEVVYDVFLTHNWGKDTEGRDNHARVSKINEALKKDGFVTWFDEEKMRGDIVAQMTDGIDRSMAIVVFVTETYMKKVGGQGANGLNDNCKLEFDYACNRKGVAKIIVVVMENCCADTRTWSGALGAKLSNQFYANFQKDKDLKSCISSINMLYKDICLKEKICPPNRSPSSVIRNSLKNRRDFGVLVEEGNTYEGELRDGKKHGKGTMIYKNGDSYVGEFRMDKRHGDGEYTFAKGEFYKHIGQFQDDAPHGFGKLITINGVREGQWKDGKLVDGKKTVTVGRLKWDGNIYIGGIQDNKKHGKGSVTYANGDKYTGDFKNDKKHGAGKYEFFDGESYEGQYKDNVKEGKGIMKYKDGSEYYGMFKNNRRNGYGKYTEKNGTVIEGEWINGKIKNGKTATSSPSKAKPRRRSTRRD